MNSDERITELETYITHQEKTMSDLSHVILDQQKTIEKMELRLSRIEAKVKNISVSDIKDISEESPPPHY